MFRTTVFAIASLALAACAEPSGGGGAGTPPEATPVELGGAWQLVELKGQPVSEYISLEFGENNSVGGDAPCNRYFGTYAAASDFSFSLSNIGATRRACPNLSQEVVYLSALEATTQYRIGREGDGLAFLDASGTTLASYTKSSQIDLAGDWRVVGVLVDSGVVSAPELSGVGLSFTADGQVGGNLGCNSISGAYEQRGESLTFDNIAVTERACFAPAPFEAPILSHLPRVSTSRRTPTGFDMLDDAGQTLIRLAR